MSITEIKLPFALGEKYWIIRSYDTRETVRCKECDKAKTKWGNVKEIVYAKIKAVDVSISLYIEEGDLISFRYIYRPDYEDGKGISDMIIFDDISDNRWIFRTEDEAKAELERQKK